MKENKPYEKSYDMTFNSFFRTYRDIKSGKRPEQNTCKNKKSK